MPHSLSKASLSTWVTSTFSTSSYNLNSKLYELKSEFDELISELRSTVNELNVRTCLMSAFMATTVALALELYGDQIVLARRMGTIFLNMMLHGTLRLLDVDLVLCPSTMIRYESIRDIMTKLGYNPTENPFRFERELKALNGTPFPIHLDLLSQLTITNTEWKGYN